MQHNGCKYQTQTITKEGYQNELQQNKNRP
jgi:hypothetical protein